MSYYQSNERQIIKIQSFFRGQMTRAKFKNDLGTSSKNTSSNGKPKYFNDQKDKEPESKFGLYMIVFHFSYFDKIKTKARVSKKKKDHHLHSKVGPFMMENGLVIVEKDMVFNDGLTELAMKVLNQFIKIW